MSLPVPFVVMLSIIILILVLILVMCHEYSFHVGILFNSHYRKCCHHYDCLDRHFFGSCYDRQPKKILEWIPFGSTWQSQHLHCQYSRFIIVSKRIISILGIMNITVIVSVVSLLLGLTWSNHSVYCCSNIGTVCNMI